MAKKKTEISTEKLDQSPSIKTSINKTEENPSQPGHSQKTNSTEQPSKITINQLISAIFGGWGEQGNDQLKEEGQKIIGKYLHQIANEYLCFSKYNVLVLYDNGRLVKNDADRVYNAATKFKNKNPLLMVLYSSGGSAASAYLIGKLCQEYSANDFIVTVPRIAKSAATLICCAAKEIHMGSLSELGPIDPQIDELPALGLKNAIEHIAELVKKYPSSSRMFADYLHSSLELINLGYYERVAESAKQYAEKLLLPHVDKFTRPVTDIAHELVYKYKDHGFVIDRSEADLIFGDKIIKKNTEEYELGNSLYRILDMINTAAGFVNHSFYFIGSLDSNGVFTKKQARR